MTFEVLDGEALCSIEEKAKALSEHIRLTQSAIEFELLEGATDVLHANAAITVSTKLNQLVVEYEAFQSELRAFIARYRLRAKGVAV
jgi:hypothetical protein